MLSMKLIGVFKNLGIDLEIVVYMQNGIFFSYKDE